MEHMIQYEVFASPSLARVFAKLPMSARKLRIGNEVGSSINSTVNRVI
jgi:hypothetical protein